MTVPVTVIVPVGPFPVYKKYLGECLGSVREQTEAPSEVLLIDDMAGLPTIEFQQYTDILHTLPSALPHYAEDPNCTVWAPPWRLGDVGAINCGVALAQNDLVFILSCDDWLEPDCIEKCYKKWEKHGKKDGYYWVGCHYSDGRPDQALAFSASMVTKGLWRETGGFAVETTGCGGDAAFISMMMVHFPDKLIKVADGKPLYNVRIHSETMTANAGPWLGVMAEVRGLVTNLWKPPNWGRMA